jgi:hypothetical protein
MPANSVLILFLSQQLSILDIRCGTFRRERCQDSSVGIATGYGLDDQEGREFESR